MRCAVVNSETREVVNVIVADPDRDAAPEGFELAVIPTDGAAGIGWRYSAARGFIAPPRSIADASDSEGTNA